MMMMVMYRRRRGEAGKPSFKFSSVDYLARERKQLTDPPLPVSRCRVKVSFHRSCWKDRARTRHRSPAEAQFFSPPPAAVKPYFKLDECKVISSERIAMGTERQLSPPSERGS